MTGSAHGLGKAAAIFILPHSPGMSALHVFCCMFKYRLLSTVGTRHFRQGTTSCNQALCNALATCLGGMGWLSKKIYSFRGTYAGRPGSYSQGLLGRRRMGRLQPGLGQLVGPELPAAPEQHQQQVRFSPPDVLPAPCVSETVLAIALGVIAECCTACLHVSAILCCLLYCCVLWDFIGNNRPRSMRMT